MQLLHHLLPHQSSSSFKHQTRFGVVVFNGLLASVLLAVFMLHTSHAKQPDIYIRIAPVTPQPYGQVIPSPNVVLEADPTVQNANWLTLPEGTAIRCWLLTPISTQTSQVGQAVEARTSQDIYIDTMNVIPQGATLFGQVTHALPPKQGRDGILRIAFSQLNLPGQPPIAIQANVHTGTKENYWGGKLTPGTERKIVPHGVLGIGYYNQEVLTGKRAMGVHTSQPIGAPLTVLLVEPASIPILEMAQ